MKPYSFTMLKLNLALLNIPLLLIACTHDFDTDTFSPTPVTTELRFVAEDQAMMDESAIEDVNVFLYGDFNYHFYFAASTSDLSFEALPGIYKMYIITNIHRDTGELTNDELLAYDVAVESMNDHEKIPMTAELQFTVANSGVSSPSVIQVKRCAAKIAYSIEVAPAVAAGIKLRSVQFCNLPRKVRLFDDRDISSANPDDYYNGEIMQLGNGAKISDVQYLFENRQGVVETITEQKDKSPENAPEYASYVRIFAQGAGEVIEYRVYLGENNTSDFNVRRNTKQTMNLVIRGKNEIDNRVLVYEGLYYGTANSIICTGSQVSFDATPYRTAKNLAYKYTALYAGAEYEAVQAGVLWQDTKELILYGSR